MYVFAALVVVAALILLGVFFVQRSRSTLPRTVQKRLQTNWQNVQNLNDNAMKVLEADKVFDALLAALGYQGSFADKLKKAGPRFSNTQALWDAHKLRNRIAHETGIAVSDHEASKALASFKKALDAFIR